MDKYKSAIKAMLLIATGIIIGGYLFSDTQPRSVTTLNRCNGTCLRSNELLGLVGSVVMQRFPGILPQVVAETDKTLVVKYPKLEKNEKLHYVAIPKKDIKNVGELTPEDHEYMEDMFDVFARIIQDENLTKCKIVSYGPDLQHVTYIHYHLVELK